MKILIVAATEQEIGDFRKNSYSPVDILITGIGSPATILNLATTLSKTKYNLVINMGISGAYNPNLKIGEVVHVKHEIFGDLGFELPNSFTPLSKSKFSNLQKTEFSNPYSIRLFDTFRQVKGLTVNSSSGDSKTIEIRRSLFRADVESMEGAAIFYTCIENNVPFVQIRAISNYIEERNSDNWNIKLAIKHLNLELSQIINRISDKDISFSNNKMT